MNEYMGKQRPTEDDAESAPRKSGRASFDCDGRSIWEWQTATGVFTRNVTEDQLAQFAAAEWEIIESPASNTERVAAYDGHRSPRVANVPSKQSPRRPPGQKKPGNSVAIRLFRRLAGIN